MNIQEHFGYLSDTSKRKQYERAIAHAVTPGAIVLDLGCGSGLLGLMALRAGAARVHFVDETAILEVAKETVDRLGWTDRAEFHRRNSFELELAERVDVVLCDHVGHFGFDYGIPALLADAKRRFLQPGGILIPARLELKVAGISSQHKYKVVERWRDGTVPLEFFWVSALQANVKQGVKFSSDELITEPADLGRITLGESMEDFVSWTVDLSCSRDGDLHGVGGWFECELSDDIWMTNSPLADDRLDRSQVFLGLEHPLQVSKGERIRATVMVRHREGVLAWVVERLDTGERHSHSTWNALLLDGDQLARGRADRVATLNERGRARQIVLSYCDGVRTIAEIEAAVLREHPDLMPSPEAISAFVLGVLGRDTDD